MEKVLKVINLFKKKKNWTPYFGNMFLYESDISFIKWLLKWLYKWLG